VDIRELKVRELSKLGRLVSNTIVGRGCGRRCHLFRFVPKKTYVDMMRDVNTLSRHACLDNVNQRSYNLKTYMEKNKNITYKHYMYE